MTAAVELLGVTLCRGTRVVLDRIDAAIGEGEFVGVLGPNGAGKTTLMRAILGLVPTRAGAIGVLGRPARRGNPAVGYMPQMRGGAGAATVPHLRGWDVVASAARGHRWGVPVLAARDRREVDWALAMVDAAHLARRPLTDLSGGERQRLSLAQALLGRPRLLLLDEPLAGLDPHHQRAVVALARALQRELGIAVLFSAHDLNPLLPAMDHVLYLGGRHAALGRVEEVVTGPVLSRLYGAEIEVVRLGGRVFVMQGGHEMGQDECGHDVRV